MTVYIIHANNTIYKVTFKEVKALAFLKNKQEELRQSGSSYILLLTKFKIT